MNESNGSANSGEATPPARDDSRKTSYIVIGVVAAAVSAATVAYVFWQRSRKLHPQVETVQQLLDRCHDQVRAIEQRLGDLTGTASAT